MREICQGIHDVFIISCGVEFFSYVLFTHLHHNIIIDLHKYVITAVQKKSKRSYVPEKVRCITLNIN